MTPPARDHSKTPTRDNRALGEYLRDARQAMDLTLRDIEANTGRAVTNGYLSQIENSTIKRPSPNVLHSLADIYGLDYRNLLERAGHHAPNATDSTNVVAESALAGLPLRALAELNDEERKELTEYIAFLRQKRKRKPTNS